MAKKLKRSVFGQTIPYSIQIKITVEKFLQLDFADKISAKYER